MITSKVIASTPQKPQAPKFPSLWRSSLTGTVFLMTGPTTGVRIVASADQQCPVGDEYPSLTPVHETGYFERIDGPLTIEFNHAS